MTSQEGWRQIRAGIALIQWSKLARWNSGKARFEPTSQDEFERWAKKTHQDFGRLICWIAFSTGVEYLVKGVCLVRGEDIVETGKVFKHPPKEGDLQNWISGVLENKDDAKEEVQKFGALGKITQTGGCLERILAETPEGERDLALASLRYLRRTIRNRDAHSYTQNVRAFHFYAVERVVLPALNTLLKMVEQDTLRRHI